MKWVEIVKLRSVGNGPEPLKTFFSEVSRNGQSGLAEMRIYRNAGWETDWALLLHWDSEKLQEDGSVLGIRLSQALKEFGPVDHSVWIEEG